MPSAASNHDAGLVAVAPVSAGEPGPEGIRSEPVFFPGYGQGCLPRPQPQSRGAGDRLYPSQARTRTLHCRQATYGIYFKDLISGAEFGINDREPIPAASTIKVPVVLYLNTLAAQGKVNWDEKIAYRSNLDYQGGAGILQFTARGGDRYSLRVLANLSITVSDNIAYRMLVRYLGKENIAEFMRDLGGETVFPDGTNVTTARDMAHYIQGVLDFARENPELGKRLLDDMANPIYHVGLPGELPPSTRVAHKEGDIWGVCNDVGVVLGPCPYILCVLSKGVGDLDQGFADIAHISKMVYDYQARIGGA